MISTLDERDIDPLHGCQITTFTPITEIGRPAVVVAILREGIARKSDLTIERS